VKNSKLLKFNTVLKERLWGGYDLAKIYNQDTEQKIGEAWILSGHREGQTVVTQGAFKGKMLNDLYLNNKELFGDSNYDKFPLLIKILDAQDDLSVQVHPDDTYAKTYYNDYGKNECWYILDAQTNSKIIYGHHAKSKLEFSSLIDANRWDQLLNHIPVKPGDFFYVPVGTVHAIGRGIKIFELQQSSDVTFRLYDYNRLDNQGKQRKLHINESLNVINYDYNDYQNQFKTHKNIIRYVQSPYFTMDVVNLSLDSIQIINDDMYTIIYSKDKLVTLIIDDIQSTIDTGEIGLVTADANKIKVIGEGTVFIIKEKDNELTLQYK
jgi:mannose-6-phosphate isomerase